MDRKSSAVKTALFPLLRLKNIITMAATIIPVKIGGKFIYFLYYHKLML